jgi:hypothetical protein
VHERVADGVDRIRPTHVSQRNRTEQPPYSVDLGYLLGARGERPGDRRAAKVSLKIFAVR